MERKIGEIFKDGNVTLKVKQGKECGKCHYEIFNCGKKRELLGFCASCFRSDRIPVHFVEVQEFRLTGAMPIMASILKFFGYKSK